MGMGVLRPATALLVCGWLTLAGLVAPAPALAGVANAGLAAHGARNPLSGMPWGTYRNDDTDPSNDAPSAYFNTTRDLAVRGTLARILSQPRFRWFGAWNPLHTSHGGSVWGIRKAVRKYIRTVTGGNRNVGVQIAVFRLVPFERAACRRLPTPSERRGYKRWIGQLAKGIGRTRTTLVLQPDMPFTLCLPGGSRAHMRLINWTARRLNRLRHTTVYIDAGAADWIRAGRIAAMLDHSGIRRVRGFALNITHYDSTRREIAYGKKVLRLLARRGIHHKHFIVSTAMNGRPFISYKHRRTFHESIVCGHSGARKCATLGRPPTTNTGSRAVDAFLWIGRPWLANTRVRGLPETLRLIRTSPFF
jgi:endoglucanase